VDYDAHGAFYRAEEGGDGTVKEKQSTTSEVIQCFCFGKKRRRGSTVVVYNNEFVRGDREIERTMVTRDTIIFRQVQASWMIIVLRHVFLYC
jgi:hypothetical protein